MKTEIHALYFETHKLYAISLKYVLKLTKACRSSFTLSTMVYVWT